MSMDLNFWKYKDNTAHDHETVYQTACCDGEVMEVLEVLPIDDILKKVTTTFSNWTIQDGGKDFEKEGQPKSIKISIRAFRSASCIP